LADNNDKKNKIMFIEIEKEAFDNLIKKVDEMHSGWLSSSNQSSPQSDWVDGQTVIKALGISKRTLQSMRDSGKIEFTKVSNKLIYYNRNSIEQLMTRNVYKSFQ
jgi:hypothetical protein